MMKINQNVILKALTFLLCFYIAIMPIFQYKTVKASAFDKARSFTYIVVDILVGLKTVGFISDTTLTPENLENIYNKADAYLHENFGTELEYAEALRQVDQLGLDIASGQIFVPGNYSGKLWYSFLNAVKDVVWPYANDTIQEEGFNYLGSWDIYSYYVYLEPDYVKNYKTYYQMPFFPLAGWVLFNDGSGYYYPGMYNSGKPAGQKNSAGYYLRIYDNTGKLVDSFYTALSYGSYGSCQFRNSSDYRDNDADHLGLLKKFLGLTASTSNSQFVNIKNKTANKVKLPTRLPQSVINNINNYYNGDTENLIIAPTADELPTLPDNYNPNTDNPPDLPGYEDVTPDQPGTTDPQPTPTPTPEPTPTPPEYDGSSWIKPIGDFFAGLLSFLKDALIPTQTVDVTPLQNMGADVSGKFPFSLPGDIGKLFGVLNAEPIRPHFEMDFDLSKVGIPGEPIHWDLNVEQWDNGAAVVKTALYIAFLIGLVFITKQFMQN
ncbi:hypothetical protein [Eubacterium limosum]|jgi:hypothetical protein|uniref:Uncharacterized protein n=1 Tax=Eubacterium limosum TaxID=1736 RepID=A0AAC9QRH3_EUBLI|nr:hypothetical protein [Eubacterium limosum]ARD64231.1 hypothetical protein B2M23_01110 [Eubacterium limosum]PWW60081.1 hypothetical protein C7955_101482 [Eubacterium limosum]UQZ21782.1 hypothetical protein M5595_16350 [Eubacterium limosum]